MSVETAKSDGRRAERGGGIGRRKRNENIRTLVRTKVAAVLAQTRCTVTSMMVIIVIK